MVSLKDAVKFSIFSPMTPLTSWPPLATGCAAPMLVPGAIAAIWAAMVMNTPADPAPAPLGATYTITGTGEPSISLTMVRVELSNPPGVSSWIMRARAPLALARAMLSRIKSSTAGLIPPSMEIQSTWPEEESFDCAITEMPVVTRARKKKILSVLTVHFFHNFFDVFPYQLLVRGIAQQICGMQRRHQFDAMIAVPVAADASDWSFRLQ